MKIKVFTKSGKAVIIDLKNNSHVEDGKMRLVTGGVEHYFHADGTYDDSLIGEAMPEHQPHGS